MERNLQQEFEAILKSVICPFFKEIGFRKNGNSFNKKCDGIIQAISLQKSSWNHSESVSFAFNIGFFIESIFLENRNTEIPKFIKYHDCQIQFRLGFVTKGNDYWYEINEKTKREKLEFEIHTDLYTHLKPLIEKSIDIKSIKELLLNTYLVSISPFFKIKICLKAGDFENAKKLLKSEYKKALNPKDSIEKTVYPDGTEIVQTIKASINPDYIEILKKIGLENRIDIE
jgi:Domain of unknown function (DUF4304)